LNEEASLNYLYRGVSMQMHVDHGGLLVPKKLGPFIYTSHYGEGFKCGSGVTHGPSETNAVIRHQLNREGFPTSGVSTTSLFERARFYATSGGNNSGVVYKIDRSIMQMNRVKEYVVLHFATYPSAPEDQEVILVASHFCVLPEAIVVEVIQLA
jgi:hypothetical protein